MTTLSDHELERIADILAVKLNVRKPPAVAPRLMDVDEAAVYLGRSVSAVKHMVSRKTLPTTRIDGKVQIDRMELDRLIVDRTS